MKKMIFSLLAIAAMTSCTTTSEDEIDPNAPVEIKLQAQTLSVIARATINQGDAFSPSIIASTTTTDYATLENILWTSNVEVSAEGAVSFTESDKHYYPTNGSDVFMKGFHPQTTVSNGKITYSIDGKTDIMVSEEVSGSRKTDPSKLDFQHLLTQIQFQVKGDNVDADMKVTKITMKDITTSAVITLSNNSIAYSTLESKEVELVAQSALTSTAVPAGTMMVEPKASYLINIETDKGNFSDIEIKPLDGEFIASAAHVITLTFTKKDVTSTATSGEWTTGTTGGTTIK